MRRISVEQLQSSERFYRVPKVFFETTYYKQLSTDAKFTYSILKDRFELSLKNGWIDKEGNVYLIFTIAELQEILGYGNKKIIKLKKELAEYGLLEEIQQGLNKPNLLYLGNVESDPEILKNPFKPLVEAEVSKRHFQKNQGNVKMTLQEMSKRHSNDTDISDTENKDNSSRKTDEISEEISQSAQPETSPQEKDGKYIPPHYYSLLQVIADKYNERYLYPEGYTLTHRQKMRIGEYLSSGYVVSHEVLAMIDRIPQDCISPYAYLVQSMENLKTERLLEEKILAHQHAQRHYGEVG